MSTASNEGDRIPMSQRERDRLRVLHSVLQGQRTQVEAARLLRLTPRHVRRLLQRLHLLRCVQEKQFRQDLYYRLAVLKITMPTLRDRSEDIPMLVRHFVQKHAKRCKVKPRPVSREALARLVNYDWPGNVRELENAIERALVLGSSDMILPEDLPESLLERPSSPEMTEAKYHAAVKELKKQLILDAVEQTQGSYADAARLLGVHPNYLHRLIRNLELKESLKDALRDVQSRGMGGFSGGNA